MVVMVDDSLQGWSREVAIWIELVMFCSLDGLFTTGEVVDKWLCRFQGRKGRWKREKKSRMRNEGEGRHKKSFEANRRIASGSGTGGVREPGERARGARESRKPGSRGPSSCFLFGAMLLL